MVDHSFGMGVDGMRLDAVPYLIEREGTNCENLPETHAFLKELPTTHVDARFQDECSLAEANQSPEDAVSYFGDGRRMPRGLPFSADAETVHRRANGKPISDRRHAESNARHHRWRAGRHPCKGPQSREKPRLSFEIRRR